MDGPGGSLLTRLMAADGMDTGFGSVGEEAWRQFVRETADALGIEPGSSVFEVGCGAGAFLYDLYRQGCAVAGLDASSALIGYARQAMPEGQWQIAEASQLDPSTKYDFVVSTGVFLYFPSLDYAQGVLERMVRKARRGVMVLDVLDLAKRDQALEMRRRIAGAEAYARKYEGLDHLSIARSWFQSTLAGLNVAGMRIEDQRIEGYANSAYRYNVFAAMPCRQAQRTRRS
jgi:trans-aconitate methyltransferase